MGMKNPRELYQGSPTQAGRECKPNPISGIRTGIQEEEGEERNHSANPTEELNTNFPPKRYFLFCPCSSSATDFLALFDSGHQPIIKNRSSKPKKASTRNHWTEPVSSLSFKLSVFVFFMLCPNTFPRFS